MDRPAERDCAGAAQSEWTPRHGKPATARGSCNDCAAPGRMIAAFHSPPAKPDPLERDSALRKSNAASKDPPRSPSAPICRSETDPREALSSVLRKDVIWLRDSSGATARDPRGSPAAVVVRRSSGSPSLPRTAAGDDDADESTSGNPWPPEAGAVCSSGCASLVPPMPSAVGVGSAAPDGSSRREIVVGVRGVGWFAGGPD
jgi:hypothetical protein